MQTELDLHREANADAGRIADLRRTIDERGIELVYYQFVSVNGRVMGKVVPARHLERNLARGVQFHGQAVGDFASSVAGQPIGGGAEVEEFVALPDPASFAQHPWEPRFGRMLCRLYRRPDRRGEGAGSPLPTCVRGNLQRRARAFTDATGLVLKSGCEPEMSWLGEGLEPIHQAHTSPAYHVGALERVREIVTRVIAYGQAMGLDMIEGDYEDSHQIELNFGFDDAPTTCDRLITYRMICAQVARELGVTATFMPKPFAGLMANGCHHNLSLWRGDENVFVEPGRRELHLTETAAHALGGLLAGSREMMALLASTVNSYARYADTGLFAPSLVNWGFDNRTCAVRISASGRLEYKLPDASVNPYLSHAAILEALGRGLAGAIDPGPPQAADSYDAGVEAEVRATARFPQLPKNLGEALDALAEGDLVRRALGAELTDLFVEYKRDEWTRFCGAVTDWHREMYLRTLP